MEDKQAEIHAAVEQVLRAPYQRVSLCQTRKGNRFWLKRVERFAPHLWLVKGWPEQAFDRDRRAHRLLWDYGAAVPRILAEGTGFVAVEDAGQSLTKLCKHTSVAMEEKLSACSAAGRALARLHGAGLAHGRPAFRDMCWDGRQIRFIDFEYFNAVTAGRLHKVRDVGVAIMSALSQGIHGPRYAYCILSAYRSSQTKQSKTFSEPCAVSDPPRTK